MAQNLLFSISRFVAKSSQIITKNQANSHGLGLAVLAPSGVSRRGIHVSSSHCSLMEFFDDPKNFGESTVKSGRPWSMSDLRIKSNSDLHKLWFVLYKERNMLYTMQEAARDEKEIFPSPQRIDKVEESMANLEEVVRERNDAYWKLEVSACASGERPRVFRRDALGRYVYTNCYQHLVPYSRNRQFRIRRGPGQADETEWFFSRYKEMRRREYNKQRSRTARNIRHLLRRFPDADVDYIQELHPEFPPGYIRHLQENIHLYDDPPARATRINIRKHAKELNRREEIQLME